METPPRRPIVLALLLSLALHVLSMGAFVRWYPEGRSSADGSSPGSLAVSLAGRAAEVVPALNPAVAEPVRTILEDLPQPGAPELVNLPTEPVALPLEDMPLDLAPVLHEEYEIALADLAIRAPVDAEQQRILSTALNSWQRRLPDWHEAAELLQWREGEREFVATVEHMPASDPTDLERAVLNITTRIDGLQLSTQMALKRIPFSHYAQVVDRWSPEVSLSSDLIDGRFHSNSELLVNLGGEPGPQVSGLTTVSARVKFEGRARRAEVFLGGLETFARRIPLPQSPSPWAPEISPDNVHFFDEDSRIVFDGDGHYRWQALAGEDGEDRVDLPETPWFIVARGDAELQVSGVVRGSVVVYSPERITVAGNLTYARDPQEIPDSTDYLGLVSDKSVDVGAPELTGPGDLNIHAAIYAKRRFRVRGYRARNHALLDIYGSVTAGTFSATEPRYATRVRFDPRLEHKRPPNFPMTERYELEEWDPRWTVVSAD